MSTYFEITPINPKSIVPPSSRYSRSRVIKVTEDKIITFETYKKIKSEPSEEDQFMSITTGIEYRPDLASYDLYGTPDFWWKLMEVNGMKDIMEFKNGRVIRVPKNILD